MTSSLTKLTIPKDCLNRKLKLIDQIIDLAIKKININTKQQLIIQELN